MYEIEIRNLLPTLRDQLCPANYDKTEHGSRGILFSLDLSLAKYTTNKIYSGGRYIVHVLFCGNTNVFYAVSTKHEQWDKIPFEEWVNESNHDSCWRSLDFFNKLYFDSATSINNQLIEDGLPEVAPIEMHQFCRLGFLSIKPWEFVYVNHERDKKDKNNYRRVITSITKNDRDRQRPPYSNLPSNY